jgi:hypothetical protein
LPLELDAALPEPLPELPDEPLAPFWDPLEPLAPFCDPLEPPLAPELPPDGAAVPEAGPHALTARHPAMRVLAWWKRDTIRTTSKSNDGSFASNAAGWKSVGLVLSDSVVRTTGDGTQRRGW